jgi:hypothetical protein
VQRSLDDLRSIKASAQGSDDDLRSIEASALAPILLGQQIVSRGPGRQRTPRCGTRLCAPAGMRGVKFSGRWGSREVVVEVKVGGRVEVGVAVEPSAPSLRGRRRRWR